MYTEERQATWFFIQSGAMCGPYSTRQLGELVIAGHVPPAQVVWREDGPQKTFERAAGATKFGTGTNTE
jgi:GYF domain 2